MKNLYTKINFKKSKESTRRGTERIIIREYRSTCRMT
ncbi:MAG: palindromic element RPE5 domain-containing protein [Rickettsia endosymbiont of Eriopis connexa]|nr:palindromic element RPE5 domain-containing protein [Rickettsia endosymbiont of Eriopis connexa]